MSVPAQHAECDPFYVNKKQALKIDTIYIFDSKCRGKKKARKENEAARQDFRPGSGMGMVKRVGGILLYVTLCYLKKKNMVNTCSYMINVMKNVFFFKWEEKNCLWGPKLWVGYSPDSLLINRACYIILLYLSFLIHVMGITISYSIGCSNIQLIEVYDLGS